MLVAMQLQELRKCRDVTQVEVAKAMSVEQAAVSNLEHRENIYVGTLLEYVKAFGGELKLVAFFKMLASSLIRLSWRARPGPKVRLPAGLTGPHWN
jgi:transcriptional regulator with XRE-family HTH domain